jgi:hypothetical protein
MRIDYDQMHAQHEADRFRHRDTHASGSPLLGWVIIGLFLTWLVAGG